MLNLKAEKREILGKTSKRIPIGMLAAVVYGHKEKSAPIVISGPDFKKVLKEAGESSVVTLDYDGREVEVLIQEIDFDPITSVARHVDFYALEKGKKVEVEVPIHFEGVSPAVKDLGGILIKVLRELNVEAMPANLPHAITVDISNLVDFDSQILVKDVKLPTGVEVVNDPDEAVAAIGRPEEEESEAAVDLSSIEVEKKGKKESVEPEEK